MRNFRIQKETNTTPLGSSAVYTSQAYDGEQYNRFTGRVFSDQGGTLALQQSDDGITWDTLTSITVTGGTASKFDEPLYLRWIRAVYTNGTTAQTTFRISLYANPFM